MLVVVVHSNYHLIAIPAIYCHCDSHSSLICLPSLLVSSAINGSTISGYWGMKMLTGCCHTVIYWLWFNDIWLMIPTDEGVVSHIVPYLPEYELLMVFWWGDPLFSKCRSFCWSAGGLLCTWAHPWACPSTNPWVLFLPPCSYTASICFPFKKILTTLLIIYCGSDLIDRYVCHLWHSPSESDKYLSKGFYNSKLFHFRHASHSLMQKAITVIVTFKKWKKNAGLPWVINDPTTF